MGALPGTLKITDISIPGTHDVGTCSLDSDQGSKSDQRYYIDEIMNAGVRHLDLRTGLNDKGELRIIHAGSNCLDRDGRELSFNKAMDWIYSFLDANPTETIVLQVKMDKQGSECELKTFRALQALARQSNSKIWAGDHVPTLEEVRGKIIVISRLDPDSFQSDSFTIHRDGKTVQWGLDCHDWKDSKDKATALTAQGSNYEVWTQDNWSHDASGKKPYIKASLLGNTDDGYTNSTLARYEQAKLVNKDAWVFDYTSCSASPQTPFKNSKEIHQWLYDRSDYRNPDRLVCSDTFTGVMAFDYVDGLLSKLVYRTNFNRQYITVRGFNSVGTELVDPITIYVGENEVTRTKLAKSSPTQEIIKAHFNVDSCIVKATGDGDFISSLKADSAEKLAEGVDAFNTGVANNTLPNDLYVLLEVPNH